MARVVQSGQVITATAEGEYDAPSQVKTHRPSERRPAGLRYPGAFEPAGRGPDAGRGSGLPARARGRSGSAGPLAGSSRAAARDERVEVPEVSIAGLVAHAAPEAQ